MTADVPGPVEITIRRASLADLPSLHQFYVEHHSERPRLTNMQTTAWAFGRQPISQQKLPLFVLEAGGRIAGAIGYVAATLDPGSGSVSAALPVNYFIDAKYKGLPALRLLRSVLTEAEVIIGAYISPDARRLMTKLGFSDRSYEFESYSYTLRRSRKILDVVSATVSSIRWAAELLRKCFRKVFAPSYRFKVEQVFDEALAASFVNLPGVVHIAKPIEFLRWRYVNSPLLSCFYVYQFEAGKPVAMAVLHIDTEKKDLVILDLLWNVDSGVMLVALLDEVIRVGRDKDCSMVVCYALSARLRPVFRSCLFKAAASSLGLVINARDKDLAGKLSADPKLHIMLGDTDVY